MKVIQYILFTFLLTTQLAHTGTYASIYGGPSKLAADNTAIDGVFKGSTLGFNVGYKFLFVGLEAGYRKSSQDGTAPHSAFDATASTTDTLTLDMETKIMTLGVRLFFLGIFDIHGGVASYDLDTIILNNTTDITANAEFANLRGDDSGAYFGLGAHVPLPKIDIFVNIDALKLTSTAFIEYIFGVRYFF